MEVRQEFPRMSELCGKEPQCFLVGALIASPPDFVQELAFPAAAIQLRIKDFRDLVF